MMNETSLISLLDKTIAINFLLILKSKLSIFSLLESDTK